MWQYCSRLFLASLCLASLSLGGESFFHVKENCFQTNAGRRSTPLNVSIIVLTGATSNKGSPIFKFPSHKTFLDEDVSKSRDVRLVMHVAMSFYRCCVWISMYGALISLNREYLFLQNLFLVQNSKLAGTRLNVASGVKWGKQGKASCLRQHKAGEHCWMTTLAW